MKIKTVEGELHFDLQGATHRGVSTPHMQRSIYNFDKNGIRHLNKDNKWVEPMTFKELRILKNYLKRLGE